MKHLHPRRKYNDYITKLLGDLEDHEIYSLSYARLLAIESEFKSAPEEAVRNLTEYEITEEMLAACKDEGVQQALELW